MDHTQLIKESERYMQNAQDALKKVPRENGYYTDPKYLRTACGIAYLGALLATDAFLAKYGKKVPDKKGRRHADNYRELLTKMNKKILNSFNTTYSILHLNGYYEGLLDGKTIRRGFEALQEIIDAAKN